MATSVVMVQERTGEDGTPWRIGGTYSASDAYARFLVGAGYAYADDGSLEDVPAVSVAGNGATYPELSKLQSKLAAIATGSSVTARIMIIGDSMSPDITEALKFPLWRAAGNGGSQGTGAGDGVSSTFASGAAVSSPPDYSKWIVGIWTNVPAGGTFTIRWTGDYLDRAPAPVMTGVLVQYLTSAGGGTFKAQRSSDGGSTWTDIGTNVDTAGSAGFASTVISAGGTGTYAFRLVGVSGTSEIVGFSWETVSGVKIHNELSLGGTRFEDYALTSAAIWAQFLGSVDADLVLIEGKEATLPANLAALTAISGRLVAAYPNTQFVWVGTVDDSTGAVTGEAERAQFQAVAALSTQSIYWDASAVIPSYSYGVALGAYADIVHLSPVGRAMLASAFASDFGLLQTAGQRTPSLLTSDSVSRAGGFLSDGGVVTGQVRVSDTTDVTSGTESSGSAAVRTAGGFYAAKIIQSDTGFASGTALGTGFALNLAKTAGNATQTLASLTLNTSGANASGNYGWSAYGAVVNVNHSGSITNSGTIRGANSAVKETGGGTGLLSYVEGLFSSVELTGAHPVTDAFAHSADIQSYGSGNVANFYGFRLRGFKGGTSVVTNAYGYFISSFLSTFATNGWAFYNDSTAPSLSKGAWTWRPAASATPAANGDLTFEATSNTSLTVKYRGSDGTVRSVALTLA